MRLILIELVKFLSVGLLLVNCRLTVGILPADSIPTVSRQGFWGALLHNYRVTNTSSEHALALVHKQTQQKARECKPLMHALAQVPHKTLLGMRGHWDSQSISACVYQFCGPSREHKHSLLLTPFNDLMILSVQWQNPFYFHSLAPFCIIPMVFSLD